MNIRKNAFWLTLGFIVNIILVYPGFMSWDAVDQLYQARTGEYLNWHPPIMAYIWSWIDLVISGPFGMLLLIMLLVWIGTYYINRSLIVDQRGPLLAILTWVIIFFPPTFIGFAHIEKDNFMAGFLLVLYALVFWFSIYYRKEDRSAFVLMGVAFCILAAAILSISMRHNAFLAVFPALWLVVLVLFQKGTMSLGKQLLAISSAILLLLCCMIAAGGINKSITRQHVPAILSLVVYDLTGIAVHEGEVFFTNTDSKSPLQAILRIDNPSLELLSEKYNYNDWVPLHEIFDLGKAETREMEKVIIKYWVKSIIQYPVSYIKHRTGVFFNLIGFRDQGGGGLFVIPLTQSRYGAPEETSLLIAHNYRLSALQENVLRAGSHALNNTWLTAPIFYLGFLLLYLFYEIATKKGYFSLMFFLALSGVMYELGLLIVAPSSGLRYSFWSMYVAWCVLIVLIMNNLGPILNAAFKRFKNRSIPT